MFGLDLDEIPDSDKYVDLDRKVLGQLKRMAAKPGLGEISIGLDWRTKGAISSVKQ